MGDGPSAAIQAAPLLIPVLKTAAIWTKQALAGALRRRVQGFELSLDTADPKEGRTSLKVKFDGESLPDAPLISQLVIVEPNSRYQVGFSARTDAIVTGGLPRVIVTNPSDNALLGQSEPLPQGTSGWQDYVFEFTSGESINAAQVRLQRQICTTPNCPIFGRLWIDKVWLRKL